MKRLSNCLTVLGIWVCHGSAVRLGGKELSLLLSASYR